MEEMKAGLILIDLSLLEVLVLLRQITEHNKNALVYPMQRD